MTRLGHLRFAASMSVLLAMMGSGQADRLGHVAFQSYGADDGLTALDLTVGLQDHDGSIWAASPNGLYRYDGVRFRRFSTEDGLPSSLLTDMAVGPDEVLWGASSRGVFFRRGSRFVACEGALPVDGMHLLAFDADGRTWVTTTAGPFVQAGPTAFAPAPGWPGGEAFGIHTEADGSMLVGRGSRLVRKARDRAVFEDVGWEFGAPITSIVRDRTQRLWVRAGVHLWMQPQPGAPFQDRAPPGLVVGPPHYRLGLDAHQDVLVPTGAGLYAVEGDEVHLVPTDLPADATNIKSVWVDREGALWLTSLGLHHELGRGLWRTITTADGLPSNNVWSVTGLHDGRIAVGTAQGVALLGGGPALQISHESVVATLEQPAGVLWIVAKPLRRYELATGELRELGADVGVTDALTSVASTPEGVLWFGAETGGLYRLASATAPRFERVSIPQGDGARVWGLAFDEGRLWVTTSRGLFVLDGSTWHRFGSRDGLRDDGLTFITARRDHEVCVSYLSPFGTSCMRYANGQLLAIRHLDEAAGLGSPVPYSMVEDLRGRLWVGGARGVSVFGAGWIEHFTRRGGAPGDDCNAGASWVGPTGEVWIGTSSGLGVLDGARYEPAPPPPMRLQRGHLGDRELEQLNREAPRVSYQLGHFDVELAAPTFLDERHVEYEVRLVGFDDRWRANEGRAASYHKLPSGEYRFEARARHRGGAWGPSATFAFVVETPWWEAWWFRAACGAAIVGLGFALARWRSRALMARNLELEKLVEDRTLELVKANERVTQVEKLSALGRLLAQLSHEINNPLNVVHNNLGPLEEYSTKLRAAITECRDLARAGHADAAHLDELWARYDLDFILEDTDQAFEISQHAIGRIARIHGELKTFLRGEPQERELVDISEGVRTTVAMLARQWPDVEFQCELAPLPALRVHPGRIQQLVTNVVTNAADAMRQRGRITVSARALPVGVELRISDTGPGIPAAVRPKIFEPFFTTKDIGKGLGLGLSICREIAVAHGGTLEIDDSYQGGACFVLTLPLPSRPPPTV